MTVCVILTVLWIINIKHVSDLLFQKNGGNRPKEKDNTSYLKIFYENTLNILLCTIHHILCKKNFKHFTMYKTIKVGFLKNKEFLKRNILKNQGIFVIKEYFKKQGILKPGNFFFKKPNFLKNNITSLKTYIISL